MGVLWLQLKAPFAAFRWMQAGVWRGTSPVIPPSAAWGLVLNLASIDTREVGGVTTLVRDDAPALQVAIGANDAEGERGSLYQQLHSYPVGAAGKELAQRTHGNKYWIVPVRRELLAGFECTVGVRAGDELLRRVAEGLSGKLTDRRYGLPFAGDNNFLFDRIDLVPTPTATRWMTPMTDQGDRRRGTCRLTIAIDRAEASGTTSLLFAPLETAVVEPPPEAWVWVPRAA